MLARERDRLRKIGGGQLVFPHDTTGDHGSRASTRSDQQLHSGRNRDGCRGRRQSQARIDQSETVQLTFSVGINCADTRSPDVDSSDWQVPATATE
jgi:hypothetical protein